MSKQLMIFGGGGFVGGNLTRVAQARGWRVTVADSRPSGEAEWQKVDIANQAEVDAAVADLRPDAVVNVAAIADVDLAQQNQTLARQVNVEGARLVAAACARKGISHIFFSSDAVFDGQRQKYFEEDPPNPVNYYGQTKADAETAVLTAHPGAVVVRVSLVLGYPVEKGNSFFASLAGKLEQGKPILTPTYEIRTPIDVITLAECVLELCQNGFSGRIHLGATGSISRYDLSCRLARRMGFKEGLILPLEQPEEMTGRAPRHKNGIISVAKAQQALTTPLLNIEDTIRRALEESPAPRP